MMRVSSVPPPHPNLGPSSSEVVTSWGLHWHLNSYINGTTFANLPLQLLFFRPRFTLEICWCWSVEMDLKQLAFLFLWFVKMWLLPQKTLSFPWWAKQVPRGAFEVFWKGVLLSALSSWTLVRAPLSGLKRHVGIWIYPMLFSRSLLVFKNLNLNFLQNVIPFPGGQSVIGYIFSLTLAQINICWIMAIYIKIR